MSKLPRQHVVVALIVALVAVVYALATDKCLAPAEFQHLHRICQEPTCPSGDASELQFLHASSHETRRSFWRWEPAIFLANDAKSPLRDLYTAEFRRDAQGRLRGMRRVRNLSQTRDADEDVLCTDGDGHLLYAAQVGGVYNGCTWVDFRGEPTALTSSWSLWRRLANRINNVQSAGRAAGLHVRDVRWDVPVSQLALQCRAGVLAAHANGEAVVLTPDGQLRSGAASVVPMRKAQPAFLAWAVDTVRAIPWVGREKIEWLEKQWFDFQDWLHRTHYAVAGTGTECAAGAEALSSRLMNVREAQDVVAGWPPPDIAPLLPLGKSRSTVEGTWLPMAHEAFVSAVHGPPLFYETFLRPDADRPYSRVYLVTWDPSRVALNVMPGLREPRSTTGLRGKGEIPRDADGVDHVSHLVGAFNGAFQAMHGEWGMIVDREVFLPPRAYGASVLVLEGARVGMGSWPHPAPELPHNVLDVRQNLHALVENGAFNPYRREWWGGVPQGVDERVVTVRTSLCLTQGGKMIYFWGRQLSPESLGAAMLAAGCDFGMHLDMNSGHCGFEYYRVDTPDALAAYEVPSDKKWEAFGLVPGREDLAFVVRKLHRDIGGGNFPRYIHRDPRDFFYLTRRPSVFDSPPKEAPRGWRPLLSMEGFPVPAVQADWENNALYKFDATQVKWAWEEKAPDVSDDVLFSADAASVHCAQDDAGFFYATADVDAETAMRGLARHSVKPPLRIGELAGDAARQWLVVRQAPRAAWERMFSDVTPVRPAIWREVFRQRGKLLPVDADDARPSSRPAQ
ncbi:MAG: hypothetical protein M0R76_01010 [Proteobacteria bacterium]|nr:hypothetical protein [Pseudomonadota bacterium]